MEQKLEEQDSEAAAENEQVKELRIGGMGCAVLGIGGLILVLFIVDWAERLGSPEQIHDASVGDLWRRIDDTITGESPGIENMLKYPGPSIGKGEIVKIVEIRKGKLTWWFRVRVPNGELTWVPSENDAWHRVRAAD